MKLNCTGLGKARDFASGFGIPDTFWLTFEEVLAKGGACGDAIGTKGEIEGVVRELVGRGEGN